jgi:hypothetical protein
VIHNFTDEFELIQDDKVREFTVEGLNKLDQADELTDDFVKYTKAVIMNLWKFSEVIEADDKVKDYIVGAGLLHLVGDKTLDCRVVLQSLMPIVGRDTFNSIMFLIERQDGFTTVYPEYQPLIDSPIHVWLLPLAIKLAKG